ncbi:MAG: hypothetical protein JWR59_1560, partial [Brevundimonas sp.]|nr:hypothetical protein [Brevundimonas sp.]
MRKTLMFMTTAAFALALAGGANAQILGGGGGLGGSLGGGGQLGGGLGVLGGAFGGAGSANGALSGTFDGSGVRNTVGATTARAERLAARA